MILGYTELQNGATGVVVMFYIFGWILPCVLTIIGGVKKNRVELGVILAIIALALGFLWTVLGVALGWVGFIVMCCFKKRD